MKKYIFKDGTHIHADNLTAKEIKAAEKEKGKLMGVLSEIGYVEVDYHANQRPVESHQWYKRKMEGKNA